MVQRMVTWVRRHTKFSDILLAVALCASATMTSDTRDGIPGLLFHNSGNAVWMWTVLLAIPLVWRRSNPEASALTFVGLAIAQLLFGPMLVITDLAAMIILYSVVVYGEAKHAKQFMALSVVMSLAEAIVINSTLSLGPLLSTYGIPTIVGGGVCEAAASDASKPGCAGLGVVGLLETFAIIVIFMLAACITGYWQRARHRTVAILRERNAAITERDLEEQHIARLAERARIARDMHDVVAHTLSIVIVQSDGGRYAGAHDVRVARTTMETIREESDRALRSMGGLFGVFGEVQHHDYGDIDALVEEARRSSSDSIERTTTGTPNPDLLNGPAGTAAFRVVQEALTNIRKYAGPNVHVTIEEHWDEAQVQFTIHDDGRGAAAALDRHKPGYGLLGMRERIEALGGTVTSGPCIGGGFSLIATIPYDCARKSSTDTQPRLRPVILSRDQNTQRTSASQSQIQPAAATPAPAGFAAVATSQRIPEQEHINVVERFSHWAERHYLSVDITLTAILVTVLTAWPEIGFSMTMNYDSMTIIDRPSSHATAFLAALFMGIPLALRRRFPQSGAVFAATVTLVHIVFFPSVPFTDIMLSLVLLYSACLYGPRRAAVWSNVMALALCAAFAGKAWTMTIGYTTTWRWLMAAPSLPHSVYRGAWMFILPIALTGYAICIIVIAAALWVRLRGTNSIVLRSHAEALEAERDKQNVLAANVERERISSEIQADVSRALGGVIAQTDEGLRLLDSIEAQRTGALEGSGLSVAQSSQIAAAFKAIGEQGRQALEHMRHLLQVLRQNEESPDGAQSREPKLHPVQPNATQSLGV